MEAEAARTPIQYHFRRLKEISTIGPHKNLQTFAENPIATMLAVRATGKPFLVSKKGNTTVAKPLLIPVGSTQKKIKNGFGFRFEAAFNDLSLG
jgi:hypothetical protein